MAAPPRRSRPDHQKMSEASDGICPPLTVSLPALISNGSDSDLRRLIYSLVSLSGLMERNREYFAAYIGVSSAQLLMMAVIAETSGATVSVIADRLSVSTQFVTAEIGKLVAQEIVRKQLNEADRRSMFLSLTPRGTALLRELGPVRRKINDMTFHSLTRERATLLQDILDDLVADARRAVHQIEAPDMVGRMAPSAQAYGDPRADRAHSRPKAARRR